MKRLFTSVLSLAVVLWISGLNPAAAQGRNGHGKPSETGLEHAESVANPQGVQHGIENAEAKQGKTDNDSQETTKSKHKKHHHKKQNQNRNQKN